MNTTEFRFNIDLLADRLAEATVLGMNRDAMAQMGSPLTKQWLLRHLASAASAGTEH